ncbi:hypothetical protein ACIHFD_61865 [Nonomuraea sp. NPDC051941]|uniref:hypothetical protein n=1 Tax=Nonomuraea sp. NPDC051941 TaxID=3364373 RepID=UPI0037C883F2
MPPDYRAHSEIVTMPRALVWMATEHLRQYEAARSRGFRSVAVDLRDRKPPEAIAEVLQVYRAEEHRLSSLMRGAKLVRRALAVRPS